MSQLFFSSVTRISDLQVVPFECRELPRQDWATGDYVRCEVEGRPTPLYRVELPAGRMCQVLDGDMIIGAFGKRAATHTGRHRRLGEDRQERRAECTHFGRSVRQADVNVAGCAGIDVSQVPRACGSRR